MAMTERDRKALKRGGVALGAIVMYFLVIEPVASGYDDLVATHTLLADQVKRAVYDNQKAKYEVKQVAKWEEKAGDLSPPKPYSEQITAVGTALVTAAQKGGVKIKNSAWTGPKPWADDVTLDIVSLRLDAEAGWENVFKFIAELYRIPGVLSIEQMGLTGDPKKGGKLSLRLTVSAMVKAASDTQEPWSK